MWVVFIVSIVALAESKSVDLNIIQDSSHWKTLANFTVDNSDTVVSKYKSSLTGLTVAVAKAESPVVNGYFCLPTQTFDNDGDPHILEHLIFMGSEDYPYKEALDYLANRCLAKRTNAWTSTDHTCYTVYTVGTSGFLQILPIYLDHILFPMLRSEDFVTEVHHINGKGHDAGVVYSEIQGSKYATSSSRALKKKVYPDGSGYYSLTGGKLENMRNTTNIEKVRDYHKKYYRPENLQLTITGRIDEEQLFNVIRPIEEKILNKRAIQPEDEYIRPWSQDLKETGYEENFVFEHVFPDEDEDKAHVLISWRLDHHIWEKVPMLEAYELMFKYLTSSKVSPFQKEFVQSEDPLASGVGFFSYKYNLPSVGIKFANVPTNRTKEVIPRMEKVVQQVLEDGPEKFDLVRIHDYIDTGLKKNIKENENGPHTFFPDATLLDKLYGHTAENFKEYVVANQWSSAHRDYDAQYWLDLIDEIFNKHKYIAVEGIPSLTLSKNITDTEKERTEMQVESLGEEGLAQKAKELMEAVASQTLPGVEILEKIPLGDVNQIQFRHLESFNRTQNPDNIIDFSKIPMKVHVDDVKSSFVTFYIFIDMVQYNLTQEQRRYLPLFTDMWIRSPMIKNGTITDIDGVIKRYNKVLIKFEMSQTHSYLVMGGQTELGLLEEAIDFVHDRINYPYFTRDDLNKTITKKLNKGTPGASSIKSSLLNGIYYDNNTLEHFSSHWPQKTFLTKLQKKIKDGKADSIIEDLYKMVHVLGVSKNSFLHIAGNVQQMTEQFGSNLSVFSKIFNATETEPNKENMNERYQMKVESEYRDVNKTNPQHVALGVDSTSSCYMSQTVMYNNTDWSKPEVAHIRVMLKYLSDRLYHLVRGQGLVYSLSMSLSVSTGRVVLGMSKSAQLTGAYKAVREILDNYVQGVTEWDEALVESAKGALIYSWAEKEETVSGLVTEANKAYRRGADSKYNRQFTVSIGNVTTEQIKEVAKRILPLFLDNEKTQSVVVCNSGRIGPIVDDMKAMFGLELKLFDKYENTFLNFE